MEALVYPSGPLQHRYSTATVPCTYQYLGMPTPLGLLPSPRGIAVSPVGVPWVSLGIPRYLGRLWLLGRQGRALTSFPLFPIWALGSSLPVP